MARSSYQKLKPIYIMDYLLKNSDEQHPVTITQLIEYLAAQGIQSERKSIYGDLEALQFYGLDIGLAWAAPLATILPTVLLSYQS